MERIPLSIYFSGSSEVRNRQRLWFPAGMIENMVNRAGQLMQLLVAQKIVSDDVPQT